MHRCVIGLLVPLNVLELVIPSVVLTVEDIG